MTEHHKQGLERRTRGPDPAPCSRRPPIPNFCHRYPEHHFLSQYCIRAQTLAFPVAVKSRIPLMFSRFPNSGADPHRFPPFYGNQWHFSHNNTFLIIQTHSTLKSGQYPVWMTRKPRKGNSGVKIQKNLLGEPVPRTLLESCAFGARLGNRSVFILDPRLQLYFGQSRIPENSSRPCTKATTSDC